MNLENAKKIMLVTLKWIFICALTGIFSGSASAFFLVALEWVTHYREHNNWIIWLLPIGGLIIGLCYHYLGKTVVKGNNLLLEEYENPQKIIPLKMAPLVLIGTLITHLFGGSAGREGTAVQMGGAISDQFTGIFKLDNSDRKTLIILGICAGFASVFGTPLAGALFALEVLYFSKISYKSIPLSFLTGYIAYFTVEFWQVKHTRYNIPILPEMSFTNLFWVILASILFGLAAMLFSRSTHFWGALFSKTIAFPPLRPFIGGIILAVTIYFIGTTKYIGLGVPMIVDAFSNPNTSYDFLLKILFTGFTLGAGFKGGEVTPLFFVGATLGSALSIIVPLPIALLAGMGFVAVFSGATHTPIACTVMGMELFGIESGIFIGIACLAAYFSSGSVGIYHAQIVKGSKYRLYQKFKRKDIGLL
ncbi:voltage-gated chloride channel family protein [Flavobacterium gawalongense]|uniref:Voltage-gated chloride channel family protein n=1 Tax=Flavobacterium gawalongense TaxID=2594432 RepID=A0A553BHG0_9FLAO|nr:voltage-gated chloride channel family protein [Flavobacterium gawalongense]TRX03328.1 voltage-gated chloride channel family protein [Flavobacterium gawalongense]TRX04069.1 voltage-gated chloride channel family protein [Flavobacterium gawalongense]TRX07669.1 voltage-gated chloride channel family protein [Flavobacterium gawalongense]TRX07818.1 voltage-gated chloride channel family protein [Flavobacterium gawalongense]TRX23589.1 voltage-gated chloride channel family protein [Flavobacterium gaw